MAKTGSYAVVFVIVTASFAGLLVFDEVAPLAGASSGSIPTNGTDWVVNQNTFIEGGSYWVKNVTLQSGFTLVIKDSTILIRSYSYATSAFTTQHSSALRIFNSTIDAYDFRNWKGTWAGAYLYSPPPEGSRGFSLRLDNSSVKGFAGHFYDATNALTISTTLAGSYIHNCLFAGHVILYPDVPLYNGTYGDLDVDGMTFWGTQYCLLINRVSAARQFNVRNLVLTRGYVMGADYPVSNAQYGAGGAGALTNFTDPRGYYYTGTQIPNRTADAYTPNFFNIRYGVKYNVIRTARVYAYDDAFRALTGARLVVTNADGVQYNQSVSGSATVRIIVAKNSTTPLAYNHLYKYPVTFRIYNATYDYTRTVALGEWESTANAYDGDELVVCSNRLNATRNKWPDNHNFLWTFASDTDNGDSVVFQPVAEYMTSLGMGATWTFWAYNQNPSDPAHNLRLGPGLVNTSRIQTFADWLRAHGHSAGGHTASGTNDTRGVWIEAFDAWETTMGWFPVVTYDHSNNVDNHQLVGSKGSDPALPRTYYNIDYTATHFYLDRYGALSGGYQADTYKYPYGVGSGALYYVVRPGSNSTEMFDGSVRGKGYGYTPAFPIAEYNDNATRLMWYQFHASGMDAPWQYTWGNYNTLNSSRGGFIGSGHWGTVANRSTAGNGWAAQVEGLATNTYFDPAHPNWSAWDPNGVYVINSTATSGISARSLFDGLALLDGYYVPVDVAVSYLVSLDGQDWLADVLHDNADDAEVRMMGGVVVQNQGDRLVVENRNAAAVEGFGLIMNRSVALVNGTTALYPNWEGEVCLGTLGARSRAVWTLGGARLNLTTGCFVSYLARSGASVLANFSGNRDGTAALDRPSWMTSGWYDVTDLTTGQTVTTSTPTWMATGGHSYRVSEAEAPPPSGDPRTEEGRANLTDFMIWAMAVALIAALLGAMLLKFSR